MKASLGLLFFPLLFFGIAACEFDADKKNNETNLSKKISNSSKKKLTNRNPKDESMREKLHGVWKSNHEPTAMQFFEDGSFRFFVPSEFHEQDSTIEEDLDFGTWSIVNGKLALKSEKGENQDIIITWVEDDLIYFGNIEEEYDSTFGTKEEFAAELGFSKIDE